VSEEKVVREEASGYVDVPGPLLNTELVHAVDCDAACGMWAAVE
jgi:hypothetical protein